jgi:peptidoglycan hydrolase-like protein with peptidoglycan-binding domain
MQRRLEAFGYKPGSTDGTFTTRTRDAVLVFQAHNALPITGVADHATRERLAHDAIPYDLTKDGPETPVAKAVPIGVPVPTAPTGSLPRGGPQMIPEGARSGSEPSPNGTELRRGWALTTVSLACLGLLGTVFILAMLIGLVPATPVVRAAAADFATPLMMAGWLVAVIGGIQAVRSRPQRI